MSITRRFTRTRKMLREYRAVLFWLLGDAFRHFPGKMVAVSGLTAMGALMQGAALAGALYYVNQLESGENIAWRAFEIPTRDPDSLVYMAIGLMLLLAGSAVMIFLGDLFTARLVSAYRIMASKRIIEVFGVALPRLGDRQPPASVEKGLLRAHASETGASAKMLRFFMKSVRNLIIVAYAIPVLIWLDARMVGILLLIVLLFLPLIYRENVMAAFSTLQGARANRRAKKRFRQLIQMAAPYRYLTERQSAYLRHSMSIGGLRRENESYEQWLVVRARNEMWVFLILAIGLALVLAIIGREALAGITTWATLIGFVIFLRLAMTNLAGIAQFFVRFSRRFPQISHHHALLLASRLPDEPGQAAIIVAADSEAIVERDSSVTLEPSSRFALFSPYKVDRFHFPYAADTALHVEGGIRIAPRNGLFLGQKGLFRESGSLREMMALPADANWESIEQRFSVEFATQLRTEFSDDLDAPLDPAEWQGVPLVRRVELSLAAASNISARVLVIDSNLLDALGHERARTLLDSLINMVIMVAYPRNRRAETSAGEYGETAGAVLSKTGRVLALGSIDWVHENADRIEHEILKEESRQVSRELLVQDDDEDEIE